MSQPLPGSLEHLGVLVTRPAHQSQQLIQYLTDAGATVIAFPAIKIVPITLDASSLQHLQGLQDYQVIIFISANAVEYGLKHIQQKLPCTGQHIAAIGTATRQALHHHQLSVDLNPTGGFSTENLLELDALQADNIGQQRILIIRGKGGREALATTLRQRGAIVDYAEVYERRVPEADIQPIIRLWADGQIQVITVSSNEILQNLYHMAGTDGQHLLRQINLVVPGQRCAQLATKLGFSSTIVIADSATDDAMLQAIKHWYKQNFKKA
ncbi:MAG: uroporphyrinogen-III synthase [Gammaproteobacteria bacterium]|nr:uroporphyrinogen-III synthase [Gammaproteobacteria bacterium]